MRVWDVQHGNAIYLRTPNGKDMVFDLGVGDYSAKLPHRSPLETLAKHYGITTIHQLVITHPHKDHIDDILNLDRLGFTVLALNQPKWINKEEILKRASVTDRPKFEKYFSLSDSHNRQIVGMFEDSGMPQNNGGMEVRYFSTPTLPETNLNNHSIITVVKYEGKKIIIPGDNEKASLDLLMDRDDFKIAVKNCDLLIAPHHGRESAYHNEFVTLANPHLTIVSDGSSCDTSAIPRYSAKSTGMSVYKNGLKETRKCLTTSSDGEIYIRFGKIGWGLDSYMVVNIQTSN